MMRMLSILTAAALVVTLAGCAGSERAAANGDRIELDSAAAGAVRVVWAHVHGAQEGTVIHGMLQRDDAVGRAFAAHVDANVVAQDGTVIGRAQSEDVYVAPHSPRRGPNLQRFRIVLPGPLAENTALRLEPHAGQRCNG